MEYRNILLPQKNTEEGHAAKDHRSSELPLGITEGTSKVEMVNPEKASDRVRDLFYSVKEKHRYPLVSSYFRGIANWPDFLEESWIRIKPVVWASNYKERK